MLVVGALAPRGGVSKVKPYPLGRGPGPERGHIRVQSICSMAGPWPREGACQRSTHMLVDGALAPRGCVSKDKSISSWTGPCPERGHIKGQDISSLTGPWPRQGAYHRSNHLLLRGALAPRGVILKVKKMLVGGAMAPRGGVSKVKPSPP